MKGSIFFQGGGHEKQIAIILNMDIYNMGYQSCHTFYFYILLLHL